MMKNNMSYFEDHIDTLATVEERSGVRKTIKILNFILAVFDFFFAPYVFMVMFNWFVVGTVTAHPISYLVSIAILMLISFVIVKPTDMVSVYQGLKNELTYKFMIRSSGIFISLMTLVIGLIIHLIA